jgi:hypothetical protein
MPPFTFNFQDQFYPCECCKLRYTTATSTAGGRKWSEKECKEEILYLAEKLASAKWYDRGDLRRRLKHWTDKLARYKELKEEFKS